MSIYTDRLVKDDFLVLYWELHRGDKTLRTPALSMTRDRSGETEDPVLMSPVKSNLKNQCR